MNLTYYPITPAGFWTGEAPLVRDATLEAPSGAFRLSELEPAPGEGFVALWDGPGVWTYLPTAESEVLVPVEPETAPILTPRQRKWEMTEVWRNRLFTDPQKDRIMALKRAAELHTDLNARRTTAALLGKADPLDEDETDIADSPALAQLARAFYEDAAAKTTQLALSIWSNTIGAFGLLGVFGTDPVIAAAEAQRITDGYFPEGSAEASLPVEMVYIIT